MGKITISLKLVDGTLEYQDSEKHHGITIETHADPGDRIEWILSKNSGIIDLTGINITGTFGLFSKGPAKKSPEKWSAKISKKIIGEVAYSIFYTPEETSSKSTKKSSTSVKSTVDPPKIKVP